MPHATSPRATSRHPSDPPTVGSVPTLPLFPLSTVLYPGLVMPLHIFEDRYRTLIAELLDARDEPRTFGIVAIRHGRETGVDGVDSLYSMGCTAILRRVTELPDGAYDITVVGDERFTLVDLDESKAYVSGVIELIEEPADDAPEELVASVTRAFEGYLELILDRSAQEIVAELPDDGLTMSYLVAATMALPLPERQRLLEAPDAVARLRLERELLARESSLVRTLHTLPATDLTRVGWSPN